MNGITEAYAHAVMVILHEYFIARGVLTFAFYSHHRSSALPTFGFWYARLSTWYVSSLSYQYIRVFHLFNLLGRYSNSPTLTWTCFAARGKCYEYVGTDCVYRRILTPPLPQTEDEYEGKFALENILHGKLKVWFHGYQHICDHFSRRLWLFSPLFREFHLRSYVVIPAP